MSWFKRRRKQPGWLALGLHADRIDLVHVRRTVGGRPELAMCDSFRKEGSDADTLTRLRRELKLEQYRCTTLLSPDQYQIHRIEAPAVPAAELKSALRWRVKDMIDYPVESATVDAIEIPALDGGVGGRSLYAVTAPSDAIARCVEPFGAAQVTLEAIDIGELAQRNVAALFEAPGEGVAMLALYRDDGLLTFTRGGELYVSRRIEVALSEVTQEDADQRANVFERIADAVQRSLDHFEREYPSVGLGKLVIAPLPPDTGLPEYLASRIEGVVEAADLGDVMELAATPDLRHGGRQAHYLSMIGAALRDEQSAHP